MWRSVSTSKTWYSLRQTECFNCSISLMFLLRTCVLSKRRIAFMDALLAFINSSWYACSKPVWGWHMRCQDTNGLQEAYHVPRETIDIARKIQRLEEFIREENTGGNGEIIIKLKVTGGKLCRFLQLAGKWFPWG